MKIMSINLNGARAAARKGFYEWMHKQRVDVVCAQEVRARLEQLPRKARAPRYHHSEHVVAEKPGYSGVSIYSRHKPEQVVRGLGWPEWDAEGRYLQLDFPGLSVVSAYIPSGSSSEARQAKKFEFLSLWKEHLRKLRASGREVIICGDWNIAHTKEDIKNWRSNQKNSGFLPEERAWMDELFGEEGWRDAFRAIEQAPEQYTWWSNRGRAWEKNVGWRLDYQVVTPGLAERVLSTEIYRKTRFSDHAPFTVEYDWQISG